MDELTPVQMRTLAVADLWQKYDRVKAVMQDRQYQVEQLQHWIAMEREELTEILRAIEDIQGEIDWG